MTSEQDNRIYSTDQKKNYNQDNRTITILLCETYKIDVTNFETLKKRN